MGIIDLIFFPVYVVLFAILFKIIRKKYNDPILKKYHRQSFWIKVFACLAFCFYNVYVSPGDSTNLYQAEGNNLYHLILHDPRKWQWIFQKGEYFNEAFLKNFRNEGYFRSEANFMIIRLVVIFSFITAGSYAAICLIFAFIAFTGIWKLYVFFYNQYPHLHKQFAIAILFYPSLVFWSSGIFKDPICVGALGWFTYALAEVLIRRRKIMRNFVLAVLFGYLLATIKIYILISYVPFFTLFILLKNLQRIKSNFFKYILTPVFLFFCVLGFTQILNSYNDELGGYAVQGLTSSVEKLNDAYESMDGDASAESNFSLGVDFDGTPQGFLKLAPAAVFATFFRPLPWETHKVSQLLACLESLALFLFTIYIFLKAGPFRFLRDILADPMISYCFLFSILFAVFIGASTLNFGSLVRYKIPCLPFYAIALFLMNEKIKIRSAAKKQRQLAASQINAGALIPVAG